MTHEITDNSQCLVRFCITAVKVSGYKKAAALMNGLPEADLLLSPLLSKIGLTYQVVVDTIY